VFSFTGTVGIAVTQFYRHSKLGEKDIRRESTDNSIKPGSYYYYDRAMNTSENFFFDTRRS